jgi:hypothetical protein
MIPEAKNDVLDALQDAILAIKDKRYSDLHAISDHVLHSIAIYRDASLIDFTIAVYALDKILETEKYKNHPKMKAFVKSVLQLLKRAKSEIGKDAFEDYSETIKEILGNIEGFSKSIKFYIEDILHFARIKKGSKLYEHGLSLGQAAASMDVTKWELMPVIGETAIHEELTTPKDINEKKIRFLEEAFKTKKKRK